MKGVSQDLELPAVKKNKIIIRKNNNNNNNIFNSDTYHKKHLENKLITILIHFFKNSLSLASLAFLLNSAALLVFGEDVFGLLSLVELFNPREVFPVKESINEVNTYRKPRVGKFEKQV